MVGGSARRMATRGMRWGLHWEVTKKLTLNISLQHSRAIAGQGRKGRSRIAECGGCQEVDERGQGAGKSWAAVGSAVLEATLSARLCVVLVNQHEALGTLQPRLQLTSLLLSPLHIGEAAETG